MAEYIEREDLLKVLPPKCNMGDIYATAYNTCLNTIENLIKEHPTADVVPVVRCEKCSFYEKVEYYHPTDKNPTKNVCRLLKRQMQPDDYCSYGERRCE